MKISTVSSSYIFSSDKNDIDLKLFRNNRFYCFNRKQLYTDRGTNRTTLWKENNLNHHNLEKILHIIITIKNLYSHICKIGKFGSGKQPIIQEQRYDSL